ncbi:MAG: ankyrin repeat domain-containing protein, partial [Planctomycetota bacterium]
MKRIITGVVAFGLLGLATSVAIAWLAMLQPLPKVRTDLSIRHNGWIADGSRSPGRTIIRARHGAKAPTKVRVRTKEGPRYVDPPYVAPDALSLPWSELRREEPTSETSQMEEVAAGWPLRCVRYAGRADRRFFHRPWEFEMDGALLGSIPIASPGSSLKMLSAMPIRPILPGLLIDAVVFAAAWMLLLRGLRAVVAILRWRRGSCARCGYDLRGIRPGRCPECGTERPRRFELLPTALIARAGILAGVLVVALGSFGAWFAANPPWPPLLYAAYHDDLSAVGRGLEAGADVNIADASRGATPIHVAAVGASGEMIDLLVEAGALVNGRSRYGNMPLHTAVRTSNRDAAATLIRAGADLDAVGTIAGDALTPALITSSVTGDIEMLRLLAHAGANLDAIPGTGADSVLEFAASRWASDRRREPADRLDFAREAIALGATVSHAVVKSAAETGDIQMLRLFEQHGAELTAYDEDGATLLWHVVRGRQRAGPAEPVIDLLLERGVDIDATGASGRTVLLEAVARRRESMVRVLLERGADPNLTDSTGAAPLDVAASAHSPSVVLTRLLLEHGAEPDLVCADGSPRFEKVHASVRSLIQAKVRKVNTDPRLKKLSEAVRLDDVATAHRLLAAGLDAEGERTPPRGETLLMGACSGAGAEMIRLLLEAGADVNARGASGYTALHRASESSHYVAAEILIESGADVNAADRYGETPVLLTRKTRDVRMLHLLAQSGADLHAGSLTGSSIIDGVVWRGDLEFVREAITLGVPIEHRNLVSAAQSGKTEMLRLLATL